MSSKIQVERGLWNMGSDLLRQGAEKNKESDGQGYSLMADGSIYKVVSTPILRYHSEGRRPFWTKERVLTLAFTPLPEDGLRFVKGVEQPKLPIVRVWGDEQASVLDYSYLEFTRGHVERINPVVRTWEKLSILALATTLDKGRGKTRVMRNLTERLSALTPTNFTPLSLHEREQIEYPLIRFKVH